MSVTMPLCQVALSGTDLPRTLHWYQRTSDWAVSRTKVEHEGQTWARVPGLPEAKFSVAWMVEPRRPFFEFEMFEFERPRMRLQRADTVPSDIGYSRLGLEVPNWDALMERIACTGGTFLSPPLGRRGERRVCMRDPEGILLELVEVAPPSDRSAAHAALAATRNITLSVPNLDKAARFWIDALGLAEERGVRLHEPEHERLWGLEGAQRSSVVLNAGDCLVELVQYTKPAGRNRPAGHLLSDQGILNIALGTTERSRFDAVFARVESLGYRPCSPPWTLPEVATVVYVQDGQGFTIELMCVEPHALERMGFRSA
jgi:catechol 2,3-dioxygenase-like lactoylglutathione lyase family enzyme